MENQKINMILTEAVRNNDYTLIRKELSFEERKKILFMNFSLIINMNLFSSEEALELYYSISDKNIKNKLIFCLDDSLKLKELDNYEGDYFEMLLKSVKSENIIIKMCEKLLVNGKLDFLILKGILRKLNDDNKLLFVDKIIEVDRNGQISLLNSQNMIYILEIFNNDGSRRIALYKFFDYFKEVNRIITGFDFFWIINDLFSDNKLEILEKYVDFLKTSGYGAINFTAIIKSFDKNMQLEVVKLFLDNGLISTKFECLKIIEIFDDDIKFMLLNMFFTYDKRLVSNELIANIIESFPLEERVDKFREFVIDNSSFSNLGVINMLKGDTKFMVLDFYIDYLGKGSDNSFLDSKIIEDANKILVRTHEFPNGDVKYNKIISLYARDKGVNVDNLTKFIDRFGYVSLNYLNSKNIRDWLNLSCDKFNMFIGIFNKKRCFLDNDTLNTVINSILQREFMLQCKEDYNIFSRFEEIIHNQNEDNLIKFGKLFKDISLFVNVNDILAKYNLDLKVFIGRLLNGEKEMVNILHNITNIYIMKKREVYVKNRLSNVYEELDLEKRFEKNFIKKKYVEISSLYTIINLIHKCLSDNAYYFEFINNRKIMSAVIDFKKNPLQYPIDPKYKKYLKQFDEILNILYDSGEFDVEYLFEKFKDNDDAKYVYSSKKIEEEYLIGIISEIDAKKIDSLLLSDEVKFNFLLRILDKYKILGWGNIFCSLEEKADFEFNEITLSGIINYFSEIYLEFINENDGNFSLTKLISYANCYSMASSKYSLLLGSEDFKLFFANSGKNKASMPRYKRMSLVVDSVVDMYSKCEVSIPVMDEDFILDNGKCINVVVGNMTNMRNITLGERTNACLRVGGAYSDLFDFCLRDKNGFHIVYNDPETNKFISRVSGIRNGNTLFLNELRNSEYSKFTDEDCVEVTRRVSKLLIERSKDSKFPIDNVVITADYAMESYKNELVSLGLNSRKEALFGLSHNLETDGSAIVIASSRDDNGLVDVKLGSDKVDSYLVQRDKVQEYLGVDALRRVQQIHIIDNLLKGISLDNIDISNFGSVVRCFSGEDWYVFVDDKGDIKKFILERSNNRSKAIEEMSSAIDKLLNEQMNFESRGR